MAGILRVILRRVSVLRERTHMLGCILETLFTGSDIYTLPSNALVHQLPRQFVESPSPEVFKNRTKYPSVRMV